MLELYKPMQGLHWRIPARLQGTSKLKINPAVGRQVKDTQKKKVKGKRTDESCLMTIM